MAGLNKASILGRLGRDPEARTMPSGGKMVSFSVATSETWTDKASGERKDRTQWHNVVIFNEGIGGIAERFLRKGSQVYIEGAIENRKYTDKDGAERTVTEIVMRPFRGELVLVDKAGGDDDRDPKSGSNTRQSSGSSGKSYSPPPLDDDIPF